MDGITINITSIYSSIKKREETYIEILGRAIGFLKQSYCIMEYPLLKSLLNSHSVDSLIKLEKFFEEDLFDSIKIAMCFENYLKGRLIKKGYIVHELDGKMLNGRFKSLGSVNNRPIKISEYKNIEWFVMDPVNNYKVLQGLKPNTIKLSKILSNPDYIKILTLPADVHAAIKNYNERRNILHLKLMKGNYLHSEKLKDLESLIKYTNTKLIKEYNNFMQKNYTGKNLREVLFKNINIASVYNPPLLHDCIGW